MWLKSLNVIPHSRGIDSRFLRDELFSPPSISQKSYQKLVLKAGVRKLLVIRDAMVNWDNADEGPSISQYNSRDSS